MPQKKILPLLTLVSVFFFWGFVAAGNDILIPVFKEHMQLEQWQSQMVSFAFYIAYTVGSIVYFAVSKITGTDILNRIGYKTGIVLGLVISAVGTLLFYPAAETVSFGLFLSALFIVGLGFSLQQIAVNPLAIVMYNDGKGSQRLSLGGGVQNFGGTVGPVILSFAIFGGVSSQSALSIESVKLPFLILGGAFLLVAVLFKFSSLPNYIANEIEPETKEVVTPRKGSAIFYPQLWMGLIAIFLYVGVEVSTASNLPEFMKQHLHTPTNEIAPYVSLFWASLMIGRWTSSVEAFDLSAGATKWLRFLMPYIAFLLFLFVNMLASHNVTPFYVYALVIIVMIVGEVHSKGNPIQLLLNYSFFGMVALAVAIFADGMVSVYAIISAGLFCSTLWPCIFTVAIAGLGRHTNEGSSLLIMMIMGGGIVSLLQGYVANDAWLGIQNSYVVGMFCFSYLIFYALRVKKILAVQGVPILGRTDFNH